MKNRESVRQAELVEGFRALGLVAGDVAFVHSSLRSLGRVKGGAAAVVQALLEALGSEGTLAAPIFRRFFWEGPEQVWDRDASPSLMGAVSEAVRTWPGARKSRHAPHPIAALGRYAVDLTERSNRSDFAFDSPFARLLELDAWIVLIGVDFSACTFIHLLEERIEAPYRKWVTLTGTVVDGGVATREHFPFLERREGVRNDFLPLGRQLEVEGQVNSVAIGQSTIRACRVRPLYERGWRALRQDPLFLVSADTRTIAARYLPEVGAWLTREGRAPGTLLEPSRPLARQLVRALHVRQAVGPLQAELRNQWTTADGLVLEELRLRGGPSAVIPAMLARPRDRDEALPAVICLHGTGGSCERLMEAACRPRDSYLLGWARELARRGFAVLAITQLAHPPRPEPWDWEWPKLLQLYGQTAMGRLVADVVCCVDYLRSRPEIDPERVAAAGFSLGGIAAFYGFAVDERLAAAAIFCGGVGSLEQLVCTGQQGFHSVYFFVPGLLARGLDHPRLLPALVPRPLLVCGTEEDAGMPLAGLHEFAAVARATYGRGGIPENFALQVDPGPHAMTPSAFERAAGWLGDKLCR